MTVKIAFASVAAVAIGLGTFSLFDLRPAQGQVPSAGQNRIQWQKSSPVIIHPPGTAPFFSGGTPGDTSLDPELQKAITSLNQAETEDQKADARQQLSAQLTDYFDRDLEKREQEITKIEERVRKLRGQIDRRKAARDDIVQLQLKVLVNQAEGLGFFGPPTPVPGLLPPQPPNFTNPGTPYPPPATGAASK